MAEYYFIEQDSHYALGEQEHVPVGHHALLSSCAYKEGLV